MSNLHASIESKLMRLGSYHDIRLGVGATPRNARMGLGWSWDFGTPDPSLPVDDAPVGSTLPFDATLPFTGQTGDNQG